MALLIITSKGNGAEWQDLLQKLDPGVDIRLHPKDGKKEEVEFVLAWNPPMGVLRQYANLKCIASTGAGVDHILKDPDIPPQVQIARVVDERLTKDMSAYLLTYVMRFLRTTESYDQQKATQTWQPQTYALPEETVIGIMGLGELGQHIAEHLLNLGFLVKGWARTRKSRPGVEVYAGREDLEAFLSNVNILICLLPLTAETRGILAKPNFDKLPQGAYIINVARGEHLVEEDLLEALDSGHLSGATLDVFQLEPLPEDHLFWANEKITITPHVASVTNLANVAPQVIQNYHRMIAGKPMLNQVSREKGY